MLYPLQNSFRTVFDLSGFWKVKPDPNNIGNTEKWFSKPLEGDTYSIAIPGSWNEQLTEQGFRNYVGKVWHETTFKIPLVFNKEHKIWFRAGAADHFAEVWVNGHFVGSHLGGFLPFEFEVTPYLNNSGEDNLLTICVDSTINMHTLPQHVDPDSDLYGTPSYERRHLFPPTRFDFFPYGGLTRSVNIVATHEYHISDIEIISSNSGDVKINVTASKFDSISVQLIDKHGNACSEIKNSDISVLNTKIDNPDLWSPSSPSLYKARVSLIVNGEVKDQYDEEFGFREISIDGGKIYLNGEELYLSGFGKHEDFPIVGRGQFLPAYLRDHELMRWIGANSYRTSHYPYDEEMMRLADRLGFFIINEVPAVSLGFWSDDFDDLKPLLNNHKKAIIDLYTRDKNHPSVISWSVTNEPNLWAEQYYQNEASRRYFKAVYDFTKTLDDSRPVMSISMAAFKEDDVVLESCDIIGINRYYGWYTKPVDLEQAAKDLSNELDRTFDRYKKPIMITEFGADTVEGLHATTAQMFTEEFQTAFIFKYLEVMEEKDFVFGSHVWNFADFMTPQHFRRVILNKKGVFTRDRNPKSVAFKLRDHWNDLTKINDNHRPEKPKEGFLIPDIK